MKLKGRYVMVMASKYPGKCHYDCGYRVEVNDHIVFMPADPGRGDGEKRVYHLGCVSDQLETEGCRHEKLTKNGSRCMICGTVFNRDKTNDTAPYRYSNGQPRKTRQG